MQTLLVTGCAGFIGSRVAEMLLNAGNRVVGVDNFNDYYDVRLKEYRSDRLTARDGFSLARLDIEDLGGLEELFARHSFDGVLNLAARAGVRYSMVNPFVYMTTNAMGTLNLLECMRRYGVGKMVLASTSSLYAGQKMPFTESLPVNTPISPYAASKKAAEVMAYASHHLYGLDVTVVRYFTVYGPAGRPDMSIFRFIRWIDEGGEIELFGDGSQSRDFTYIDDIARGTIAALRPAGYEIINLGGGNNPVSLNEVIAHLETMLGRTARIGRKPFHQADIPATWADISRARALLDWEPQVSLVEGLQATVDWYRDNRSWAAAIELP